MKPGRKNNDYVLPPRRKKGTKQLILDPYIVARQIEHFLDESGYRIGEKVGAHGGVVGEICGIGFDRETKTWQIWVEIGPRAQSVYSANEIWRI